jgi:hypothetical protein
MPKMPSGYIRGILMIDMMKMQKKMMMEMDKMMAVTRLGEKHNGKDYIER